MRVAYQGEPGAFSALVHLAEFATFVRTPGTCARWSDSDADAAADAYAAAAELP